MKHLYNIALSFATEDNELVEKVYHYLKAEGMTVFFAPALECQPNLSGKNQREVFYEIFGLKSKYVALFVSKSYVVKTIPMEEASISIAKHSTDGSVVPIYIDETQLPASLFNPQNTNYFKSNNPAEIANHLATKIKKSEEKIIDSLVESKKGNVMNVKNNHAEKQIFVQTLNGTIK